MIHVNYYFRNSGEGNFSIEIVFDIVINKLNNRFIINRYNTKRPIDLRSIFLFRQHKGDLFHITGAVNYLAFGLPASRTIITVHDVGHYAETLRGLRKLIYKYFFWKLPLRRARMITTISDFSKQQLIKHFSIRPEKIVVIPNPVNPSFRFVPRRNNVIPVILQIGAGKNKNVETLLEAVKTLKVKLLLIRPVDETLIRQMDAYNTQYEFRHNLTEEKLMEAYAESDIVYFASTYEGFGLPILEAMAIGRPVITSNLSPMKDITLDNGILVDPLNANQVREGLQLLLTQPAVFTGYVERGLKHAQLYNADHVANLYNELYQRMINE